jgi:hypothetical protein
MQLPITSESGLLSIILVIGLNRFSQNISAGSVAMTRVRLLPGGFANRALIVLKMLAVSIPAKCLPIQAHRSSIHPGT